VVLPGFEAGNDTAFSFPTFAEFLRMYIAISCCLVERVDLEEVTVDLGRRLAAQNVRYAEVTFTPIMHRARGVSSEVLWDGLTVGRARARHEHGVELRWVFDVVRSLPDQAEATLEFALGMRARDDGAVVGLGAGGPEREDEPVMPLGQMFARGKAEGFKSLPHAGELAGPPSIWRAVRDWGADRIGHGIRCLEDPHLVDVLCERGIALEVCPTSNIVLGVVKQLEAHPLPRLIEAGVQVSLGSDDPTLFGTDLVSEYLGCARAFAWDAAMIRRIAAAAVDQSFAPPELAARLRTGQNTVKYSNI
jgi:aminodeoxyfutalosine deaminase